MARAVVDTSVILSRKADDDPHHETAREIMGGIDRGGLPTAELTEIILTEILNWIHRRAGPRDATDMLDRLVEGAHFNLVHSPKQVFDGAMRLVRQYEKLSFGDAMIVGYMKHRNLEYLYSFDGDFDSVNGITRLNAAENPFV
jgi:predicted nucleic acid-binding protein